MEENYKLTTTNAICNSLRRIMIAEIPTFAIDIVGITKNDSMIPEEMIAHRLGLIPIFIGAAVENEIKEIHFELMAHYNEKEAINGVYDVYSSLIKFKKLVKIDERGNGSEEEGEEISVNPDIIITKLKKGQEIAFDAIAISGIGITHAKWSPSCGTSFTDNEDGTFNMHIETIGNISAHSLFNKSIDHLINKLERVMM
jgi:DNA-directed RNA polymerase alpha subunit